MSLAKITFHSAQTQKNTANLLHNILVHIICCYSSGTTFCRTFSYKREKNIQKCHLQIELSPDLSGSFTLLTQYYKRVLFVNGPLQKTFVVWSLQISFVDSPPSLIILSPPYTLSFVNF